MLAGGLALWSEVTGLWWVGLLLVGLGPGVILLDRARGGHLGCERCRARRLAELKDSRPGLGRSSETGFP